LVLRRLVGRPLIDTQITLISDVEQAPYSGMLPGHLAGFYRREEVHIDLRSLCHSVGAEFVHASADGLDLTTRRVLCDGKPRGPEADLLSINVGSSPRVDSVPGAAQWVIPSKPVPQLLAGWEVVKAAAFGGTRSLRIFVVGGGAGGVELTLALQSQLMGHAIFTLVHDGPRLLPGHSTRVLTLLSPVLSSRGVTVLLNQRVTEVQRECARLRSGEWVPADFVFWITEPSPPAWLRNTDLLLDERGFIRVESTLQAVRHPGVFAAGDVATIEGSPLPKSGVFAVRMAVPLEANLRAVCEGRALRGYKPQRHFLSLIGTADGRAVASRRFLAAHSRLMWRWKDRIDRRFMRQFDIDGL